MVIVEIKKLSNGAHRSQYYHGFLPEGWAADKNNLCNENFPYGDVEAEEIDGVMTVTKWTPGEIPETPPEEPEKPTDGSSVWDELDAAYQEGVDSV